MRRLAIAGATYLWRVSHRHAPPRCAEMLTVYREGHPRAPLRIVFTEGDELGVAVNLHEPGTVRTLIEHGLAAGWQPAADRRAFVIDDGWAMLR